MNSINKRSQENNAMITQKYTGNISMSVSKQYQHIMTINIQVPPKVRGVLIPKLNNPKQFKDDDKEDSKLLRFSASIPVLSYVYTLYGHLSIQRSRGQKRYNSISILAEKFLLDINSSYLQFNSYILIFLFVCNSV